MYVYALPQFYVTYTLLHIMPVTQCITHDMPIANICRLFVVTCICRHSMHAVSVRCPRGRRRQFVSHGRQGGITAEPGIMQYAVQVHLPVDIHQSCVTGTRTQQQ